MNDGEPSRPGPTSCAARRPVVDAERLRRILQRVSDDLAFLHDYARAAPEEILADPARTGHVKYLLVTALEGCIDAAQHVCASEGWGPPASNSDAVLVLARHGVLDPGLADTVAAAVRLRNLLVHRYAEIDDRRVVGFLTRVGDLDAYVAALAGLL